MADSSTACCFVVEKQWFDKFLAFKDSGVTGKVSIPPGKINNGKLLLASSAITMNGAKVSSESLSAKVDTDVNNSGEDNDEARQLRRQRWQRKQEEEKKGDDISGGQLQCRPELRKDVDFVLVGKETWSLISSQFSFDVELPQQQQHTISRDSTEMLNSGSDSKQSEMDAGDAGSSVAVARSASSLVSEGSSKSDLGDDLVSLPRMHCHVAGTVDLNDFADIL